MAAKQVILTGVTELDAQLKAIPLRLQKKALRPALRESAKIVQQQIKLNAPKDTGRTRKSVKVRAMKRSRTRIGVGISSGADFDGGGTLPYYAKWVEFGAASKGTVERTTKDGKSTGILKPQPFMRKSLQQVETRAIWTFRRRLTEEIAKLKAKVVPNAG